MKTGARQKIVIIGCGNLSWHLAKHLASLKKYDLIIYNHRENKNLDDFSKILKCKVSPSLNDIVKDAVYYFICVSDRYIRKVSGKLSDLNSAAIVMHTSGSKDISELHKKIRNRAVFYPVQTFSKKDDVSWKDVPVLVEANGPHSAAEVKRIAGMFTKKILAVNSIDRAKVHLAAVLVNNFCNALYLAADNFLAETANGKINFKLLLPLIGQTNMKAASLGPARAQTGPALRKDEEVMRAHLKLLNDQKDLKKIYRKMSQLINSQQK